MDRLNYVYVKCRNDTGEICYVGKGKAKRWQHHSIHNQALTEVAIEHGLTSHVLYENMTVKEANAKEIELIAKYKLLEDGGTLFNKTYGGDGLRIKITEARKAQLVANLITPETIKKRTATRKANFTQAERDKISRLHKGKKLSKKHRLAFISSVKTISDEGRLKIIEANKRRKGKTRRKPTKPIKVEFKWIDYPDMIASS